MKNPITILLSKLMPYDGIEQEMAKTFLRVMIVLAFPIIAIAGILLLSGYQTKSLIVISLVPCSLLAIYLTYIGKMKVGLVLIVILADLIATWISIIGFGIHDIAIIIYPTTILISNLILQNRQLWFIFIFAMLCISTIGLGEYFQFYVPKAYNIGNEQDLIMIVILLSIGLVTSNALSSRIKTAIKREQNEVSNQEELAIKIQSSIGEKTALYREVHHRVKNHLSFVNSLIDLEVMANEKIEKEKMKELQTQIIAVARVHDHLYKSDTYETINTKDYLETLISNFLMTYNLSEAHISFQIDNIELKVRTIISLGVSIHEIIHLIAKYGQANKKLSVNFILTKSHENIMTVICNQELSSSKIEGYEEIQLVNFMIQKTGGKLDLIKGKNKTLFEFSF